MTKRTSLVWSRRIAPDLSKLGVHNSIVVGVPWVHLLRALKFDSVNPKLNGVSSNNVLHFPNHSGHGYLIFPTKDISDLVQTLGASKS